MPPVASWPTSWYRPRFVKAGYHAAVSRALALVLLSGCFFEADYSRGHYTCSDGVCPSGLACVQSECVTERKDAAIDTTTVVDGMYAATCSNPQPFPSTGGMTGGTTAGRSNTVTSMCGGAIQNGTDAVYKIEDATDPILVSVTGSFAVTAYALSSCPAAPATPACETNMTAVPGNPLALAAGTYWIVVDSANAAASGTYTLKVEVQ
jgi:hypothetical protein